MRIESETEEIGCMQLIL